MPGVDWGAGRYERTAAELAPVAAAVIDRAAPGRGDSVVDVACGTGNAAIEAAARGAAPVIGVDGAARLLEVARERARQSDVVVDFRQGDLLALPVDDGAADLTLSVFGVIFAPDTEAALRELARVTRSAGRVLLTAWVPAGPIDAMLTAFGRTIARVAPPKAPPPPRFAWHESDSLRTVAGRAGLELVATDAAELAIRDASPEAYVAAGEDHPMALAGRALLERAGATDEVRNAMVAVLTEANEDPDALLLHSPYVVHELRPER